MHGEIYKSLILKFHWGKNKVKHDNNKTKQFIHVKEKGVTNDKTVC